MAASNRSAKLTKIVNAVKKRFKPTTPQPRPLFETILYACLLENSDHESAEKALSGLESGYFDWNEVRVSSRTELAEALKPLNDPGPAADRLKRTLQSLFETFYSFDLESMKKQNLGQSVKQIEKQDGVTPFVVSYVTQNGLAGHSIACNKGLLIAMHVLDAISDAELKKGVVPGLERVVPKTKGVEVGSMLHELGVEIGKNPYGSAAKKLLLEIDPSCKDRLPKKPKPQPKPEPKAPAAKTPATKTAAAKTAAKGEPKKAEKPKAAAKSAKKPAAKGAKTSSKPVKKAAKPAAKKKAAPAKKKVAKKAAKKAPAKKTATKKPAKKKASKTAAKKKPAKKVAKKKVAKKATKKTGKKKPR